MAAANLNMVHVPIAAARPPPRRCWGETKVSFIDAITALPHRQAGTLKMLAVSTATRTPLAQDVPTLQEAGVAGFESSTDMALMAPAGLPEPIVNRLSEAVRAAVNDPPSAADHRAGPTRSAARRRSSPPTGRAKSEKWAASSAAATSACRLISGSPRRCRPSGGRHRPRHRRARLRRVEEFVSAAAPAAGEAVCGARSSRTARPGEEGRIRRTERAQDGVAFQRVGDAHGAQRLERDDPRAAFVLRPPQSRFHTAMPSIMPSTRP